jgi:hypothetical protein
MKMALGASSEVTSIVVPIKREIAVKVGKPLGRSAPVIVHVLQNALSDSWRFACMGVAQVFG